MRSVRLLRFFPQRDVGACRRYRQSAIFFRCNLDCALNSNGASFSKVICLMLLYNFGVIVAAAATPVDFDVVVYGSSPAGIAASVAAGLQGLKVALFEPLPMIGGMGAAGNLALNDGGMGAERTGLALNFSLRNGEHYYPGQHKEVPHPESFVAEASFYAMLKDAGVETVKVDCRALSATTTKDGTGVSRVQSISVHCLKDPVTATVFIDASYDGEHLLNHSLTHALIFFV